MRVSSGLESVLVTNSMHAPLQFEHPDPSSVGGATGAGSVGGATGAGTGAAVGAGKGVQN